MCSTWSLKYLPLQSTSANLALLKTVCKLNEEIESIGGCITVNIIHREHTVYVSFYSSVQYRRIQCIIDYSISVLIKQFHLMSMCITTWGNDSLTVLENLAMYVSFKCKLRRFDRPAPILVCNNRILHTKLSFLNRRHLLFAGMSIQQGTDIKTIHQ